MPFTDLDHITIANYDDACRILGLRPAGRDLAGMGGYGWAELRDEDGTLKELCAFRNLITNIGDDYYAQRAAGTASPPNQVTGMKLGTGTTAVAKSGAGAAIVTYAGTSITASKAIDATWPQKTNAAGSGCQIQWRTSWAAGECTVNALAEVVLSNQTSLADSAGTAADTIARALLSPTINKGASDTLVITWNHVLLGA